MAFDPISLFLGIGSLLGGIGKSGEQGQANAMSREQLEMMKRVQDYLFKRQARVDPIFEGMLSQGLLRSASVPRMAGAYGKRVVPLYATGRGYRARLPEPRLIGDEPKPPAGGGTPPQTPPSGTDQTDYEKFLDWRKRR